MSCSDASARNTGKIGAGVLVLVVGPSGAGKDTLIRCAKTTFSGDPRLSFPQRVITRRADSSEDNEEIDTAAFLREANAGAFALHWSAHGLHYALRTALIDDIRNNKVVVVNASRRTVEVARERFLDVRTVLVTASDEILARRLAMRGRDPDVESRLARATLGDPVFDFRIVNDDPLEVAASSFNSILLEICQCRDGDRPSR